VQVVEIEILYLQHNGCVVRLQIYAEAECRTNFICYAEAQQYMCTRSGQI
jgi:hypothetical protein